MFEKSATSRHKNEARVLVTLTGQAPFEAFVFLKVDERLIDLLNDQRQFIPIKRADGSTLIASKLNIVSIIENPQPEEALEPDEPPKAEEPAAEKEKPRGEEPRSKRSFDPYEVLRVEKDATVEEIRRAYHVRIKAVHPDTLAKLELDEDIERAANVTAQRVNRAYKALLKERRSEAKHAPEREEGAA